MKIKHIQVLQNFYQSGSFVLVQCMLLTTYNYQPIWKQYISLSYISFP